MEMNMQQEELELGHTLWAVDRRTLDHNFEYFERRERDEGLWMSKSKRSSSFGIVYSYAKCRYITNSCLDYMKWLNIFVSNILNTDKSLTVQRYSNVNQRFLIKITPLLSQKFDLAWATKGKL
jgi:hypothetical protein